MTSLSETGHKHGRVSLLHPLFLSSMLLSATVQALPLPVIQEVYYDQPGADGSAVFTELYGQPGYPLDGWNLIGLNGNGGNTYRKVSLSGAVIPGDGILLITTASALSTLAAVSDFIADIDWQNGPDALLLVNGSGEIIDSLQYGYSTDLSAAEDTAAEDVEPGSSLSRRLAGFDTDNNANDFIVRSNPTPGEVVRQTAGPSQLMTIAEPGTASLMWLILLPLLRSTRNRAVRRCPDH